MNKFPGPDDGDFGLVAGQIQKYLRKIREGTPLERMDRELNRYYRTGNTLRVERLSDDKVSMDVCYINLTIVEQITQGNGISNKSEGATTSFPFSLAKRLGVDTPDEDVRIEIPDIFNGRVGRQASKKVLIRGRAGIGKTTLCKKIVYDFLLGRIWTDLFDRIFWLPLRELKASDSRIKDLGEFFDKYISGPGKEGLAHSVWTELDQSNYDRTLFILDGLDEVSQGLPGDHNVLRELMRLPNLIVTSRPYVSLPYWLEEKDNFHLELETIGFYPDQVKSYVQNYFTNEECKKQEPEKAEVILSFLQRHPLLQSLMRIPVQLDALCWTWVWGGSPTDYGDSQSQTMTAIYMAMEKQLWQKDAMKLGRAFRTGMIPSQVSHLIQFELRILELLAFAGMYSDVIDFRPDDRDQIFEVEPSSEDFDERLDRLSFLRSSDPPSHSEGKDRYYHFLHLTFQEYFAARYFVRQWRANEDLNCLDLVAGNTNQIPPAKFLGQYKYNVRYDIVWRFVAGLLDLGRGLEEPERFFRTLDQKPLDLFGVVHQRLLVHCLSETGPKFSLRGKIEGHLSKWLVFQCRVMQPVRKTYTPKKYVIQTLATDDGFPAGAFVGLLEECDDVKAIGFESRKRLGHIPSLVMEHLISMLDTSSDVGAHSAIVLLTRSSDELSEKLLRSIASRFWRNADPAAANARLDRSEKRSLSKSTPAYDGLCEVVFLTLLNSKFSDELWCEIAANLEYMSKTSRGYACQLLAGRSIPTEQILFDFVDNLESKSKIFRNTAAEFLSYQSTLPQTALSLIQAKIERGSLDVRRSSIHALKGQLSLPESLTRLLATMLYQQRGALKATLYVLPRLSTYPHDFLDEIILNKDLEKNDSWLRHPQTAYEWCHKSTLSEQARKVLVGYLTSITPSVRCSVIRILDGQPNLPEATLRRIVIHLKDHHAWVRAAAKDALSRRPYLSETIVNRITAILDERIDGCNFAELAALHVLKHQSNLSKSVLDEIADCIDIPDPAIKIAAIKILACRSDSPDILNTVTTKISHQSAGSARGVTAGVLAAAIQAFNIRHTSIPKSWLGMIELWVNDDNSETRNSAVQVLIQQSHPSEKHLNLLASRINDEDVNVRLKSVRFLEKQTTLTEKTIHIMASQICGSKSLRLADPMQAHFLVNMLIQRDTLHLKLLLRGQAHQFLLPLLLRTFKEHFSWHFQDGKSYLVKDNLARSQSLRNEVNIEGGIDLAREEAGFPSVAVNYS